MASSGWPWSGVSNAAAKQMGGVTKAEPKSGIDAYLACLSKVDLDQTSSTWFLFFDMVPAEAVLLGLMGKSGESMPPPETPVIYFHATDALQSVTMDALGLKSLDDLAEGSWYVLWLQQGGDRKDAVVGDLYHPDLGFVDGVPEYGDYQIAQARLLSLPVSSGPKQDLGPLPEFAPSATVGAKTAPPGYTKMATGVTRIMLKRYSIKARRRRLLPVRKVKKPRPPPPPPQPPAISAVGIMDIGQGGFNLLVDAHHEPLAYFDAGYPLPFFRASLPPEMLIGGNAFLGPIYQNAANNLEIILSHWDYDHWRFGRFVSNANESLGNLPWTVPTQNLAPSEAQFLQGLNAAGRAQVLAPGFALQAGPGNCMIYECVPAPHAPAAFIRNNSGLALRFSTWLPVANQVLRGVLLTADANFDSVNAWARLNLSGIGAVHHGSNNHGAAQNLPVPAGGAGQAFIGYSYGVSANTGTHAYGFPAAGAVANYLAAGWTAPREQTTAEGPNINAGPLAHGNIRMGDQTALPNAYNHTAFFPITYALS